MPTKKLRNRAVMLDAAGSVVARYDKLHMFDVDLADGESYRESEVFESGGVAIAEVDPAKVEEARAMIPALRHDRPLRSPKPVSVGRASG